MGRWSESRSSPMVNSALSSKDGCAKDSSEDLRPPVARLTKVAGRWTQSSSCLPRVPLGWFASDKGEWALRSLANLQAGKVERVGDASGSDGGHVDVADCSTFSTGGLDLGREAFWRRAVFIPTLLEH